MAALADEFAASMAIPSLFAAVEVRLDSPAFRKRLTTGLEECAAFVKHADELKKATQRWRDVLGEAAAAEADMAKALDGFGAEVAGMENGESASLKNLREFKSGASACRFARFADTFRELGAHREVLTASVDQVLCDKVANSCSRLVKLREFQKSFDKASHDYDVARDKVLRLDQSANAKVVEQLESEAETAKARFNTNRVALVGALAEAQLTSFGQHPLEALVDTVGALTRYHSKVLGFLGGLTEYVDACAQDAETAREERFAAMEQLQTEMSEAFDVQLPSADSLASSLSDGLRSDISLPASPTVAPSCDSATQRGERVRLEVEALMMHTRSSGVVVPIKEGYLLKRSTNSFIANDWKRRYFRLDTAGNFTYLGSHKTTASGGEAQQNDSFTERRSSFFSSASTRVSNDAEQSTVPLMLSTIKFGTDDTIKSSDDKRFVFRVVSPERTYALQAESERDFSAWIDAINGVIATLLNFATSVPSGGPKGKPLFQEEERDNGGAGDASGRSVGGEAEDPAAYSHTVARLRSIPGNATCVDCGANEPVWASVNLGCLMCIECSGIHRQLGVHISKVRSLTLDTRVWVAPGLVAFFERMGNTASNALWERTEMAIAAKPAPSASLVEKESFIRRKYVDRAFAARPPSPLSKFDNPLWVAVQAGDVRELMGHVVAQARIGDAVATAAAARLVRDTHARASRDEVDNAGGGGDSTTCTLLHLAAASADPSDRKSGAVLEALLQNGGVADARDTPHLRTPLHYAAIWRRDVAAKQLLARGGNELAATVDAYGNTALDLFMSHGSIADEELFLLLAA